MATVFEQFVSTYIGAAGVAQSGFQTFSFDITGGFEALIPIMIRSPGTTSISAGAEVIAYRMADVGSSWETEGDPRIIFNKPTAANQIQRRHLRLTTGRWLVGVMVGGGSASTWSCQFGTAEVIASYG